MKFQSWQALLLICVCGSATAAQTIITVAGGGPVRGEGPATGVSLANPQGLAVDAAGNLFIAETDGQRICRVDAVSGQLTVLAGTGVAGFADGAGSQAQFSNPSDVAVDGSGNVYVADTFNAAIRKIDPATATVSTIAGGGTSKESGVAGLDYLFNNLVGVTFDGAGALIICDNGDSIILKMNLASGLISRIAGTPLSPGFSGDGGPAASAQFSDARRVAVDAAGNLIVFDGLNHRVRRINAASGVISTIAGTGTDSFDGDGGPAISAMLNFPTAGAVAADGSITILDTDNLRVRRIDPAGTISTLAGTGFDGFTGDGADALRCSFLFPLGLVGDAAGNIYIADTFNNRIRKIGTDLTSPYDSDADGFPNHVEAAALTNAQDAASTPFSNAPLLNFDGHGLTKLAVSLNFKTPGKDAIQFSGNLPIPEGISIPSQQLIVNAAGIAAAFTLDTRGKSTPKGVNSFKLSIKQKDGLSKYSCKLKGDFRNQLASLNLTNTLEKNRYLALPVTIFFGQKSFTHSAFLLYSAKPGKSGAAKQNKNAVSPGNTRKLARQPG